MNLLNKENEIKLDILRSLARSQRALCKMLECVAEFPIREMPEIELLRQIEFMSRYQHVLAEKIIGLRLSHKRFGRPTAPWMSSMRINFFQSADPSVTIVSRDKVIDSMRKNGGL